VEEFGIDWDGPVGRDDDRDATVIVEDIQSPLTELQEEELTALLADLNDSITEEDLIEQYLAARGYVDGGF